MYKFIQQIINSRQGVDILLDLLIQCTIINSHSQLSSLLPNEDDRSTPWATRWFNPTLSQIIHLLTFSPLLTQLQTSYTGICSEVQHLGKSSM